MNSRQRVETVLRHGRPDRLPIYGWVRANMQEPIEKAFGSVEAFEDHYEFDLAHLFGGPYCHVVDEGYWQRRKNGYEPEPGDLLDLPFCDPNASAPYDGLRAQLRHYKEERGRFVYVQTPGLFEHLNASFGIENHLAYLLLFEDELRQLYRKQAEWNRAFAMNCLDLGVDMIHVSDDWGGQNNLLFSPDLWWRLLEPAHRVTAEAVKKRGAWLSLHSDGHIHSVVDGIIRLGFDVVHPWQESAGMSLAEYQSRYQSQFTVMGGLDVQTTIGFGRYDHLRAEIERLVGMFAEGGLLLCTSHAVQNHCTLEELTYAYDLIYKRIRQ